MENKIVLPPPAIEVVEFKTTARRREEAPPATEVGWRVSDWGFLISKIRRHKKKILKFDLFEILA